MAKHAWITGASGGIGRAIALRLASEGYAVTLGCFRNPVSAGRTAEEIQAAGGDAAVVQGDIADCDAAARMADTARRTLGDITLLVNNAGFAMQALLQDMSPADWRGLFSVHVDGMFYCTKAVLPAMIASKAGAIINISSIWGITGGSCEVAYSSAKAAVIGFTRALAKEVGPSGITVNCVAPGVIQSDMNAHLSPADMAALCAETPLGRTGTPQEVAGAVAFLASPDARFITGQVLSPNGGLVI